MYNSKYIAKRASFTNPAAWYLYKANYPALKKTWENRVVELCDNHTGKMESFVSLSTNPLTNPHCIERCKIAGSICQDCYSNEMNSKMYPALREKNQRNTERLTRFIIGKQYLPKIDKEKFPYFRFESFGDLHNEIHFINYLNICDVNPGICFTIWTKNPEIMKRVFAAGYEKPKNLTIVLSGLFKDRFIDLLKVYPFADKVFTVWTTNETCEKAGFRWNCPKRCKDCLLCYDPARMNDGNKYIHELLK